MEINVDLAHATVDGDSPSRVNEVLIAPSGVLGMPSALPLPAALLHLHMSSVIVLLCATQSSISLLVTPVSSLGGFSSCGPGS